MKKTYITTSIAYVNAEPHIGFLYELLAADVLKRHFEAAGDEVFFLTGTDEHGIKVAQAAEAVKKQPQAYVDDISKKFESLGKDFNLGFSYFIRTTNPEHEKFVQEKWQQLEKAGVLKKKKYAGLYCSGCEAFKAENEIENGKCVIHEKELEKIEEENWFLQIKDKREKIKDWIKKAVFPESKRQEVLNILDSGAYDEVSLSRSKARYSWGIPVPGDEDQIMYVWADALFNYLSALKINNKENLWPADVQIIGKDILKFHAIIWPALLLTCGYELPKKLLVHGFVNVNGKKLSKSTGNIITPTQLKERYGVEASRYLLCRQLSFYDDSNFTWEDFDRVYHGELANGLGNLVSRVVTLLKKFEAKIEQTPNTPTIEDPTDFAGRLSKVNELVTAADGWITEVKPWTWEKPETDQLQNLSEQSHLSEIAALLAPFTPETSRQICQQLSTLEPKALFPRISK